MNNFNEFYNKDEMYFGESPSDGLVDFIEKYKVNPNQVALDIGAGEGRNSRYLASLGFRVDAVEPTSDGAGKIRAHNIDTINVLKGSYVDSAIQSELKGTQYGLIVAGTSLDHMSESEVHAAVSMIRDSLEIGGYIYIVVFTEDDPGALLDDNASECANHIKHYFAKGELLSYFDDFEIFEYREYMKEDNTHGPTHMHGKAKIIGRKK